MNDSIKSDWGPSIPTLMTVKDIEGHTASVSFTENTDWMAPQSAKEEKE